MGFINIFVLILFESGACLWMDECEKMCESVNLIRIFGKFFSFISSFGKEVE